MRTLFLIGLWSIMFNIATAQELSLDVSVIAPNLNLVDPQVFKTLENAMTEFFNNTSFTDDDFQPQERITGNVQLTITQELSAESFNADLRIQSIRPVYNSNYSTQLLNYIEKNIVFTYREFQPIDRSVNGYVDNLSSILSFFAYAIIGFDYDSFSELGGQPYFNIAQNIMDNIPTSVSSADEAWTNQGPERSRFWLLENIMSPRVLEFRKSMYAYHRQGLDRMTEDTEKAKNVILEGINVAWDTEKKYPNAMIIQMFTDSKRSEILEIFKQATKSQQRKVFDAMVKIDPARSTDYGIFK